MEFVHYDYKFRGTISAKDFALSMVASADLKYLHKLLARVDDLDNEPQLSHIRISFEEFKSFAELRKKLQPFSLALFCFGQVNGLLTRSDFKRAASQVCTLCFSRPSFSQFVPCMHACVCIYPFQPGAVQDLKLVIPNIHLYLYLH